MINFQGLAHQCKESHVQGLLEEINNQLKTKSAQVLEESKEVCLNPRCECSLTHGMECAGLWFSKIMRVLPKTFAPLA